MLNKKKVFCCTAALLAAAVSGCGANARLENAYSYEERVWYKDEYNDDMANAFAENLSVIIDEEAYTDSLVNAEAAGVFALDSPVAVYSKNAFERLYPASTTKVMTALIAIKYGNLSDKVVVTEDAMITEAGATLCNIKVGDVLTLEQLLYGLMLPSGNDAGAAIAIHMSGTVEAFSELMNQEAEKLGATGTHFMNPHGLNDEEHYTTAYDLYLIFNEALKHEMFRKVTGTTSYAADYINAEGESVSQTWKGGNWYIIGDREAPDGLTVFGGKTGTTAAAGYCLVMASRDAKSDEYISVVLKAPSRPQLYENMDRIIKKISE